jgi:predicted HAD superfamily Cof-like phosphohydrolase
LFNDVKDFTVQSNENVSLPKNPIEMKKPEVMFLLKMVISECFEFLQLEDEYTYVSEKLHNDVSTVPHYNCAHHKIEKQLFDIVEKVTQEKKTTDKTQNYFQKTSKSDLAVQHISGQADAGADIIYYIANAFSKVGVNLGPVLEEVHRANMDKRDKITGKFIRNTEGKIQKPQGYKPADISVIIKDQY